MYRKTYVEINVENIKNNVKNIINYYNDYEYYIGVVKGNSYGHGNYLAKYLVESGINYLAVSSLEEALEIRKIVNTPILCLEPIDIQYIDVCINNNITITVSSYDYYKELINKDLTNLKIHLKIDTGMNRLGFKDKNIVKEVYDYFLDKNVLEGIYTHMGTTGINDKNWDNQIERWNEITSLIDLSKVKIVHIGRSTTLVNHKKILGTNGVRLGIIMYGIKQSKPNYSGLKGKLRKLKHDMRVKKLHISETTYECPIELKNAFYLCSEVMEVKSIKKGDNVGYGFSYKALNDTKIAVLPVGYADGLSLRNSNRDILINDRKYKIVGSINMGMITVEVDDKVKVHDKAIVIGDDVKQVASHCGVTPYVVMTSINPLVPRIYIENDTQKIIE